MGTVHHLPDTFRGPEHQGELQRFPSDRPVNLQVLRPRLGDMIPPEPIPLSPEGLVLLAIIETLSARKGLSGFGEAVFQTVCSLPRRWADDAGVRASASQAIGLVCARHTGRW